MTVAKKAAPRKAVKKLIKPTGPIEDVESATVDMSELNLYYRNPRIGSVDDIVDSLKENGQFRRAIVNRGTHTGRPNEILVGNHMYLAMRKLNWPTIRVDYCDVDNDRARKMVLVDNRLSQLGGFDDTVLQQELKELTSFDGSGYSELDFEDLNTQLSKATTSVNVDLTGLMPSPLDSNEERPKDPRQVASEEEDPTSARSRGVNKPTKFDDDDAEDVEASEEEVTDKQAELQGILEAREEEVFKGNNFWQIPDLREDMLLDRLPDGISTWAGWEATPDDGKKWFLYQYSLGGVKGLPYDRSILSFFTHDRKFMSWLDIPAYYTAKFITAGVRAAIVPDFSFYYSMPRITHLTGVQQAQWLGRFFQEAGMKVIPRVQFDYTSDHSLEFCMTGIPKNPPVLSCSVQNLGGGETTKQEDEERTVFMLQHCVDAIEPTNQLLVYGGNPGERVLSQINTHGAEAVWIPNYAAVRRGTVFDKKDGMMGASPSQRKKIREKARDIEQARKAEIGITEPDAEPDWDEEAEEADSE